MPEKKIHGPWPLVVHILVGKKNIHEIMPQVHMNLDMGL